MGWLHAKNSRWTCSLPLLSVVIDRWRVCCDWLVKGLLKTHWALWLTGEGFDWQMTGLLKTYWALWLTGEGSVVIDRWRVCCDWQVKGLLKTGQVVRRLRDAYNRCVNSASTHDDAALSCSQMIRDILVLLQSWPTYAAFHWTREVVITSSRAVKQRSIDLVSSWTRNHERWTRVGFVHLEFTVGVAPWHDVMQFKVDWI